MCEIHVKKQNVYALGSPTRKKRKEEYCYEFVALPVVSFLLLLCCCSGSIQRRRCHVGRTLQRAPAARQPREPMWRDKFARTWSHAGHDLRNRTNKQRHKYSFEYFPWIRHKGLLWKPLKSCKTCLQTFNC